MIISDLFSSKDACPVCGQTPCNCTHIAESVAEGSLNEFAPGGNSASSYYAVTANFVSEFAQQKEEEIQDLISAGWTKQDLEQAGTLQGQAADIAHFEQVRDGFLKGLKPGFDAYLQGDTQMKDQLGEYWLDNDLPLNQDWEKIYGEPWGEDMDESVSNRALSEFSIGGDDDGEPKDDPYKYPKPEHYRRSIDFFGKFEANHFDKEDMDDATGVFKGYWYYGNNLKQIAYFKFDNPQRTGSNDPGMGWYYEPQDEDVAEGSLEEYGDTAKGQKMLTKVQKRAVDRMIKADDKRDAAGAKKNQQTANRAWDRMTDKDLEENSMADFFTKAAQEKFPTATIRKNGETIQEPPKREVPVPAAAAPVDIAKLKQQYAELEKRYNQLGGDSWQYADRMMPRDLEAQQVQQQMSLIARQIDNAKGLDEGDKKPEQPEQPEADYGDEYQAMVGRLKKLAGMGPLKTVYDPKRRVYRNMPTAVQPPKK